MYWARRFRQLYPTARGGVGIRGRLISAPTLVSFVLAGVFLGFLVTRFDIDLGATWDSFKSSNPLLFALAVVVHYTTFLFRGARWRLLLQNSRTASDPPTPGVLHCSSMILLGWFANSVTWFRLGDAYRAYVYAEDTGGSFSRTIGTILAERVLDMALVLVLLVAATLFLVASGVGTFWEFVLLAGVMVALLAGVLVLMRFFRRRLARLLPGPLEAAYHRFHEGTVGSFRRLPLVTLLGLLGWLAEVGRLYLVAEALGFSLGPGLVIFVTLASAMLTLVPITPGGLGAVEWGVTRLLMLSSTIAIETDAFSVVALDRSISWLSIILVGAALFVARAAFKRRRRVSTAPEALTGPEQSLRERST